MKPSTELTLALLRAHPEGVTALNALDAGVGFRLSGRVLELRQAGFNIETTWVETYKGARIARYVLREAPVQMALAIA